MVEIPPMVEHIRVVGLNAKSHRIWAPPKRAGRMRVRPVMSSSVQQSETQLCCRPSVIREIEIWRVEVLMVNHYADEGEANSFRRRKGITLGRLSGVGSQSRSSNLQTRRGHGTDNGSV